MERQQVSRCLDQCVPNGNKPPHNATIGVCHIARRLVWSPGLGSTELMLHWLQVKGRNSIYQVVGSLRQARLSVSLSAYVPWQ